jgi:O-antigen/teichoic acid export membrane protein
MKNKIIKSGSITLFFSVLQAIISLFLAGYSLKIFGEKVIGSFYLLQSVYLFVVPFLGSQILKPALTQYIAEKSSEKKSGQITNVLESSLGYTIIINGIFSLCLCVFTLFFWGNHSGLRMHLIALVIVTCLIDDIVSIFQSFTFGQGKIAQVYLINGILGLCNQIGQFAVIIIFKSFEAFVYFFILKSIISLITLHLFCYYTDKKLYIPRFNIKQVFILPMFNKSSYIGSLSDPIGSQADKLILGLIGGAAALPLYVIAQKVLAAVHAIIYNISYTFFPLLAAEGENAINKARQIDFNQRWVIAIMGALLYSATIIIFPLFFSLTAGKEMGVRIVPLIALASFQGILVCNASIPIMGLMALKETKVLAVNSWINQIILLLATVILTFFWGALGAAFSRTAYLFQMIHAIFMYSKKIGFNKPDQMFRPMISSFFYFLMVILFSFLLSNAPVSALTALGLNVLISAMLLCIMIFIEFKTVEGKKSILYSLYVLNEILIKLRLKKVSILV